MTLCKDCMCAHKRGYVTVCVKSSVLSSAQTGTKDEMSLPISAM